MIKCQVIGKLCTTKQSALSIELLFCSKLSETVLPEEIDLSLQPTGRSDATYDAAAMVDRLMV